MSRALSLLLIIAAIWLPTGVLVAITVVLIGLGVEHDGVAIFLVFVICAGIGFIAQHITAIAIRQHVSQAP